MQRYVKSRLVGTKKGNFLLKTPCCVRYLPFDGSKGVLKFHFLKPESSKSRPAHLTRKLSARRGCKNFWHPFSEIVDMDLGALAHNVREQKRAFLMLASFCGRTFCCLWFWQAFVDAHFVAWGSGKLLWTHNLLPGILAGFCGRTMSR